MDWTDFQQRARAVIPEQELKPKRCWIGVLSHEKGPEELLEERDFVWMIGHSKIALQKIYQTYGDRHGNRDFQLRFQDKLVNESDIVKSFLNPDDDLVLFQAKDVRPIPVDLPSTDPQPSTRVLDMRANTATFAQVNTHIPLASRAKNVPEDDATTGAEPSMIQNTVSPMMHILANQESGTEVSWDSLRHVVRPSVENIVRPLQDTPSYSNRTVFSPQYSTQRIASEEFPTASRNYGVKEERRSPSPCQMPVSQTPLKNSAQPFDPDSVFNREPSPNSQQEATFTDRHVRTIIEKQDPDILEVGVAKSMVVLENLTQKMSLYISSHADAQSWLQSLKKVKAQAERRRTIVGVVGNTGAGKSSVINAMLDEERLVPTNCMRACTAVVTEISWNNSTDASAKYRAEIEFIGKEDWEKELNVLMKEFLTENGTLSREASDPNSDAGIAWAKFHSVYPKIPKESLNSCIVSDLMSERVVVNILGNTRKISTAKPDHFYQELQKYVDSKEKVNKKEKDRDKTKQKEKRLFETEYWPLIKVVKIYTKSSALSTGAVIVDLPGVHDSNAARSAIAQGYMKQCTGLWIVAPINRAVDDKAAKTLLGDTFKRQLKYDGGFSSVTFICSKTDDISITEAIDSLGLEDEAAEFEEQQHQYNQQIEDLEGKIADLKESQDVYKAALLEANNDIEIWEGLQEDLDEGKMVFEPLPKIHKRKKASSNKQPRKQRPIYDDNPDDDFLASDDEGSENNIDFDDEVMFQEARVALTETEVKDKLKELRETKKNARRAGLQIRSSIEEIRPQIRDIKVKIDEVRAKLSHICIAGRNEYSKTAIQQDFAAGIKEIDQENAAEDDEDNFNPDEDMRDYDQVARSLPVFCVSSRAYQKMCGRLQKDDGVPGFLTPEETQIPQLQAHCKKLTERGRIQTCRTFLLSLCQLLTTLNLWAFNDGTGLNMTDSDKRKQIDYLNRRLKELDTGLQAAIRACIHEMRAELKHQIFDKYPELISNAIEAAPNTANAWGYKEMGGLAWVTYKAVVRRDGAYHSATAGHRDFNSDLVNPIIKKLATGWERAFQSRLPKAFNTYIANSGRILQAFHEAIEKRVRENGVGLANLSILKTQIHTYEQLFKDLGAVLITQMTELQREANRDFTPTIASIMHTVYDICTAEHGQGSYKRMKEHMMNHVERERHRMFHEATRTVGKHLDQMCKALQNSMETRADEIFVQMNRDYMQVLGGMHHSQPAMLQTKEERMMRSNIKDILRGVDAQFEPIANGELDVADGAEHEELTDEKQESGTGEDNDGVFFESAQDSADGGANEDSFMDGDDTMLTEPTPQKPVSKDVDMGDGEKGNMPTVSSDDDMDLQM
ncbi:Nn.00g078610.m01.CDS01 [Neocucurbitaria sp. VM-36]